MDQAQTSQFVQYVKAGDKAQAMRLLAAVLRQNPRDEQAWLAMAQITEGEQQKDCLKRVLAISPHHPDALRWLAAARPAPAATPEPLPKPLPKTPAPRPRPTAAPAKRMAKPIWPWIMMAGMAVCLIGLLGIAGVGWLVVNQNRQAAPAPVMAATPLTFPTFPPTWTPASPPTGTPPRPPTPKAATATASALDRLSDADRTATAILLEGQWVRVLTFSGKNTTFSQSFNLGQGHVRLTWTNKPISSDRFSLALMNMDTQVVEDLGGGADTGSVEYYVFFTGSYSVVVDSLGEWTIIVEFRPDPAQR